MRLPSKNTNHMPPTRGKPRFSLVLQRADAHWLRHIVSRKGSQLGSRNAQPCRRGLAGYPPPHTRRRRRSMCITPTIRQEENRQSMRNNNRSSNGREHLAGNLFGLLLAVQRLDHLERELQARAGPLGGDDVALNDYGAVLPARRGLYSLLERRCRVCETYDGTIWRLAWHLGEYEAAVVAWFDAVVVAAAHSKWPWREGCHASQK